MLATTRGALGRLPTAGLPCRRVHATAATRSLLAPALPAGFVARSPLARAALLGAGPRAALRRGFATEAQDVHAANLAARRANWPHVDSGWGPTETIFGRLSVGVLALGGIGYAAFAVDRKNQKDGGFAGPTHLFEQTAPGLLAALVGWGVLGAGLLGVWFTLWLGQRAYRGPKTLTKFAQAGGIGNTNSSFSRTAVGLMCGVTAASIAWFLDGRADLQPEDAKARAKARLADAKTKYEKAKGHSAQ